MNYILEKLKQPSTHAGIAALCGSLAIFLPQYAAIFAAIAAAFGGAAATMPHP